MMSLQTIYDHAPVCLQNLMCSVKGWTIVRRRYGKEFFRWLSEYENHKIDADSELQKFFEQIRYVPAYKQVFANAKDGRVKLSDFPIISKADVKAHYHDYLNTAYTGTTIMAHTSGTTGTGLAFPYPVEFENKQWAVWWRYRKALGIKLDSWQGWFGGKMVIKANNNTPPHWRINKPGRQVMFSSYHISMATIADYHKEITKRQLSWLHGYPSTLTELALTMVQAGLEPISCVKVITTGAENLTDYQIEQMQQAFPEAIVRTHYGLTEGVANMSQDKEGNWQVDKDFAYVEFVPVDDTGLCRIVGTGFSNKAFPLVRYDTGDLAIVKKVDGRDVIVSVEGRQADFIRLKDGRRLGPLNQLTKDCLNIAAIQYVQNSDGDVRIKIVRGANYTKKEEVHLKNNIKARLEGDCDFPIEYVDKIERTKTGKVKLVIQE